MEQLESIDKGLEPGPQATHITILTTDLGHHPSPGDDISLALLSRFFLKRSNSV